jgi:hypothetical protein
MPEPKPDPAADPGPRPAVTPAWRNFRRMQGSACVFILLLYAAAALRAWTVLQGPADLKRAVILIFPAFFAMLALWTPLAVAPLRRRLKRYVWLTFAAGFGQSVGSVVIGLGVLAAGAGFLFLEIARAAHGGRWPAGAFSALGAGAGVLMAQAVLTTWLEREPKVRDIIRR